MALPAFALGGLQGTSTDAIADAAGISQPYLFRLFGTKKELFLACHRRACDQVMETFRSAAAAVPAKAAPEERLIAMGKAYESLLVDRHLLLFQMQSYVGCADGEIRAAVRRRYSELFSFVERASGAAAEDVLRFFATGMLLNVSAAMGLVAAHPGEPERWATAFREAH